MSAPKSHSHRARSAKQRAASHRWGEAGAAAARRKHHKGSLTSAQMAADRVNGKKAGMAMRGRHFHVRHGFHVRQTAKLKAAEALWIARGEAAWKAKGAAAWARGALLWKQRGAAAWRSHRGGHRGSGSGHALRITKPRAPLGIHLASTTLRPSNPKPLKPTSKPRSFSQAIMPTAYGERTGWRRARVHHFKKVLKIRKPKRQSLGHWRRSAGRVRPY